MRQSIHELGLGAHLVELDDEVARTAYAELERRFATRTGARWIWEHLRPPDVSRRFEDDKAFERLALIVPSASERLLFFPGSDDDTECAFEGTIASIAAVLADCPGFEYLVAPFDLSWLLCENHHGVLIAVGEPVAGRLRALG